MQADSSGIIGRSALFKALPTPPGQLQLLALKAAPAAQAAQEERVEPEERSSEALEAQAIQPASAALEAPHTLEAS